MNIVLIVGSSTDAIRARAWQKKAPSENSLLGFQSIVAINNAWKIRDDWDYLIHPDDFPKAHCPKNILSTQKKITSRDYVPAQNAFGGVVYIGGTMAFTTAYWVLHELKPDVIAFVGCDMVYPKNNTHFYGKGSADPLREDITLQSLEAKAIRLQAHAAEMNCLCLNLSSLNQSRLVYPKIGLEQLWANNFSSILELKKTINKKYSQDKIDQAKVREKHLNYFIESGDYWHCLDRFDADELYQLDQLWLSVVV